MKYIPLLLFLFAVSANASDCPASDEICLKAVELVRLLGHEQAISDFQSKCHARVKEFSPDIMIEKDPAFFGTITKASKKWPAVVAAFGEYDRTSCSERVKPVLMDAYRDAWRQNLSAQELTSIVNYLKSSEGQAFAKSIPLVYAQVYERTSPAIEFVGKLAYFEYRNRVREIASE